MRAREKFLMEDILKFTEEFEKGNAPFSNSGWFSYRLIPTVKSKNKNKSKKKGRKRKGERRTQYLLETAYIYQNLHMSYTHLLVTTDVYRDSPFLIQP